MRISTQQTWNNALRNLMEAQNRQNEASTQVSTRKVATDLMGYGRSSEIIAAYKGALDKTNSYLEVTQRVSERLNSQNIALETTAESASESRQSILNSIASDDGTTLMLSLQGNFSMALQGLNYRHNGQYLFAGGSDGVPVGVSSMAQLAATTDVSDAFNNGTIKKASQIDSRTSIQTGMIASELGTEIMGLFREIQQYNDDPATGPFGNKLTDAQKTFLTDIAGRFDRAHNELLEQTAINGTMQNRVENVSNALTSQGNTMSGLISDRTDVDLAEAYSRLEMAEISVQASAQVLAGLRDTSLLYLLK